MTLTITRPLQTARRRVARAAALTAAVLSAAACFAANPATADASPLLISVTTCDAQYAGTDANVHVRLEGTKSTSAWLYLNSVYNDFERADENHFSVPNLPELGTIKSIVIKRDTWGLGDAWCLSHVQVTQSDPHRVNIYSSYSWVPAGSAGTRVYRSN